MRMIPREEADGLLAEVDEAERTGGMECRGGRKPMTEQQAIPLRRYDVWICFANGRTTYCATLPGEQKPVNAVRHLDTVTAYTKREATRQAVRDWKARMRG